MQFSIIYLFSIIERESAVNVHEVVDNERTSEGERERGLDVGVDFNK